MFAFETDPAQIDIGEGVNTAFYFLENSWRKWLPVVVIVAVANLIVAALVPNLDTPLYRQSYNGNIVWIHGDQTIGIVAGNAILVVLGLVAGWIYIGIVIAGLRGRPITAGWIVGRGLLTVVAGLVIGVVAVIGFLISAAALTVAVAMVGRLAILLVIAVLIAALMIGIRLAFAAVIIFDGSGPMEALADSWDLTRGALMRMVGWGLVAIAIALGFVIAGTVLSLPFASGDLRPVSKAISSFSSQLGSCAELFLLAVLYESQQARCYAEAQGNRALANRHRPAGRQVSGPAPDVSATESPIVWPLDQGSTTSGG